MKRGIINGFGSLSGSNVSYLLAEGAIAEAIEPAHCFSKRFETTKQEKGAEGKNKNTSRGQAMLEMGATKPIA
jgi:hypothetical protein